MSNVKNTYNFNIDMTSKELSKADKQYWIDRLYSEFINTNTDLTDAQYNFAKNQITNNIKECRTQFSFIIKK